MELRALSDEDRLLWTVRRDLILYLWHCPAISTCGEGLEEARGDLLSFARRLGGNFVQISSDKNLYL